MANKEELARVLQGIEDVREAFPFDTNLIPEDVLQGFSSALDCMAEMARFIATHEGTEFDEDEEGGYDYDE